MRQTENLGLSLYDTSDKMNITGESESLNHNMELIDEAVANIKSSLGLPASVKNAILECFSRVAWTDAEGINAYQRLESAMESIDEPSGGESGGESGSETLRSYRVTYNLTNCTVDNRASIITEGKNYVSSIVPNDGYELLSCSVTIGDVTSEVDDGNIIVNGVTSDITINAICSVVNLEISSDEFISGKTNWNKSESTIMKIVSDSSRASWIGLDIITKANQKYMITISLVDTEASASPVSYGVQRFNKKSYDTVGNNTYLEAKDSGWKTSLTYNFTDSIDEYVMFAFNASLETTKSKIKSVRIEKVV